MTNEEARVYNAIPVGQKNAIKLRDLCAALGFRMTKSNGWGVRETIKKLRRKHYNVCTTGNGYYKAANREEYAAFVKYYAKKKNSVLVIDYHNRKTLDEFDTVPMEISEGGIKPRRRAL